MQEYLATLESQKNQNEKAIVSNVLAPFLQDLGFFPHSSYKQKGNSEIDLALLKDNQVEVIIEAKKPDSKEFFSEKNPNCKALCECILYYLRERERGNINLNFIIITNFYEFYVFRASEFRRCFYKNKKIDNLYKILNQKGSQVENQTEFYTELSKILSKDFRGDREENLFNTTLKGTYFDLRNALQSTTHNAKQDSKESRQDSAPNPAQNTKQDDTEPRIIAHILSKAFLHNEIQKDTNALNKGFYNELLHILGLEEFKQNNKTLIRFDTQKNSFATMIYKKLKDSPHNKSDEEAEESTMSHIIIWLNRVLFLKLIEANLLSFNDNNESLRFLTSKKVTRFSQLSHLFFEVLAKDYTQRGEDKGFAFLPYLNSSLFMYENAKEPLKISELDSDLCIELFTTSILKKQGELESSTHSMNFLSYLFDFLSSYDFGKSPQNKENKEQETKELINSSVLGSVFEKLNGYKEGSFYTPSFITSYMCKESLSKIVCEKFNALNPKWKVKSLKDIKGEILAEIRDNRDKQEQIKERYTHLLKSIKICDPAVGSGHFLVAALNEMIKIHFELELFGSEILKLELHNDELIIKDKDNTDFAYKKPQSEEQLHHQIQKKLFTLKKDIIENNLFGVDINPNSCEIARLRLWIELLKHSYYVDFTDKHTHKLETLPNIDINIKCGNSLISRFALQDSFKTQNIKHQVQKYKDLVFSYKNANKDAKIPKQEIEKQIDTIKQVFTLELKDPETAEKLRKALQNHLNKFGLKLLDNESLLDLLGEIKANRDFKPIAQKLIFTDDEPSDEAFESYSKIMALRKRLELVKSGESFKNAFEWRFAFPEVLDDEGNFVGFDLIVGNPPYIRIQGLDRGSSEYYKKHFKVASKNYDIYILFVEQCFKLIKPEGEIYFIMPHKWFNADFGLNLREFAKDKISKVISFQDFQIFDASTYTALQWFKNNSSCLKFIQADKNIKTKEEMSKFIFNIQEKDFKIIENKNLSFSFWNFEENSNQEIFTKINQHIPVKDIFSKIFQGLATSKDSVYFLKDCKENGNLVKGYSKELDKKVEVEKGILKPLLMGDNFHRYEKPTSNSMVLFPYYRQIDTKEKIKMTLYSENELRAKFPKAWKYLKVCENVLRVRENGRFDNEKWYQFGRTQGINQENITKLLCPDICNNTHFVLDNLGKFYFTTTIYGYVKNQAYQNLSYKYLMAILNSKLTWRFLQKTSVVMRGGFYRIKPAYIEKFCIPNINSKNQKIANKLINLVDEILKSKAKDSKADTSTLENQIDNLVYKLYNLSEKEIEMIEG